MIAGAQRRESNGREIALFFLIAALVRLSLGNTPLVSWDEWILGGIAARLGTWALPNLELYDILVPTGYSYPSFGFWVNSVFVWLFGSTPFVLRLPCALSEAAAVALTYALARELAGVVCARAAALFATACLFLSFHAMVSLDYLLSAWVLLSLWAFVRAARKQDSALLVLAAFCGGMACFTKYHGVVYHATLCVLVFSWPTTRRMLRWKTLTAAAAAALAAPLFMLATEAATWHFYGYSKTHIAEVLRVTEWASYVADPRTGAIVEANDGYYFLYAWTTLGPLFCGLAALGFVAALASRGRVWWALGFVAAAWLFWASTASLKNARYILPMVYVACIFAGYFITRLAAIPRCRGIAWMLVLVTVALGAWQSVDRAQQYFEEARRNMAVYDYVNTHTPKGAVILAESIVFQVHIAGGPGIVRTTYAPESPQALDRADYLILDPRTHEMLQRGVLPVARGYLDFRREAEKDWPCVFRKASRQGEVRVLARPQRPLGAP